MYKKIMEQENLFDNLVAQKPKCNVDPRMLKTILEHYQKEGFPYQKLSDHEKLQEFVELMELETPKIMDKTFISNSTGVALANFYHPHRYEVVCNNHKTAISVFKRQWQLERCIKKCIALSGSVDDAKLRSMLSIFEGTQVASNFPPGTAKMIYDYFLPSGGCIWDMSCGFGGRLLAALSLKNIHYHGTDPSTKTFYGLRKMCNDLKTLGLEFMIPQIFNQGSEIDLPIEDKSIDFCFTSPPYFDTEKYALEDTQSYKAYPYPSIWIKKFIGGTAENCHRVLKQNHLVALNIANVKSFPNLEKETVKEFCLHGFVLDDTYFLAYSMMPGRGKKNKQFESGKQYRKEPIFIFRKQ